MTPKPALPPQDSARASARPSADQLSEFIDLLAYCDDVIRSSPSAEVAIDQIFGAPAVQMLGFRKGYVAAIDTTEETFHIVRLIMPARWVEDGDSEAIAQWVGTKRPVKTPQGRLVQRLVARKHSILIPDFERDANVSPMLQEGLIIRAAMASPFVIFDKVIGYLLLAYESRPSENVQWMQERLVAYAIGPVIQSFWAARFRTEVELGMKWKLLGQQASALTHYLKTPIGTLKICIGMLRSRPYLREDDARVLDRASGQVERLQRAVFNLLSFARDVELRLDPIRVRDLLHEATSLSVPAAANAVVLGNALDKVIYVDLPKISHALSNVITNAYECPLAEGTPLREVAIRADSSSAELTISVLDNGKGLASELPARLFEPFFSTKHHGQGLGLAVAERFVSAHGGRIHARNRPEGGACFQIILPLKHQRKEGDNDALVDSR